VTAIPGFSPTHAAPHDGLPAWSTPDPSKPTQPIPPDLEVEVADRFGDWARVVCSNGWTAWVDGTRLIDVTEARARASALMDQLGAALNEYERAVEDATAGRIDEAEFQARAFKAGMVLSDTDAWFLDLVNARWCRYDGFGIQALPIGPR
jgi:hypothetical protein